MHPSGREKRVTLLGIVDKKEIMFRCRVKQLLPIEIRLGVAQICILAIEVINILDIIYNLAFLFNSGGLAEYGRLQMYVVSDATLGVHHTFMFGKVQHISL